MTPIRLTVCAAFAAALFIAAVFAAGQTFGQRAAKHFPKGSPEWQAEVKRLAEGRQ